MVLERELHVIPSTGSSVEIRTCGKHGVALPTIGVRAFDHSMEIVVVDLAGRPAHTIVIRQNGNVEVDA
jgi:hypothetical protein